MAEVFSDLPGTATIQHRPTVELFALGNVSVIGEDRLLFEFPVAHV